jgi:UDPglucose--hexose-1-phosphate uridylyltransferase
MSRIRFDPLSNEPVLFAPERRLRPNAFDADPSTDPLCPFCPGNEEQTPAEIARIAHGGRWEVRVVPNRYPMVGGADGPGAHEVVIETPSHDAKFATLENSQRERILRAYRERFAAHRRNRALRHIVIFRNEGPKAGQTIVHAHAQIVGLPFIPERHKRQAAALRSRSRLGERCPLCEEESSAAERVLGGDDHFVALAPLVARSPYQMRIQPTRHSPDFGQISEPEIESLAALLGAATRALDHTLGSPSWNLVIQNAPLRIAGSEAFHWYVDLVPRLALDGGFELATGIPVNIVPPEETARELRHAMQMRK